MYIKPNERVFLAVGNGNVDNVPTGCHFKKQFDFDKARCWDVWYQKHFGHFHTFFFH